jgi:hypothetical protein
MYFVAFLDEPAKDDGGIEAAGISKDARWHGSGAGILACHLLGGVTG